VIVERDYFLEQVGQVAQVEPLSAQHFMPQAGLAEHLDLLQQAQPVARVAAHTRAAQRVRSFVGFIRLFWFELIAPFL
jgi:hypothetical protein